jgi:hypothetical protein
MLALLYPSRHIKWVEDDRALRLRQRDPDATCSTMLSFISLENLAIRK